MGIMGYGILSDDKLFIQNKYETKEVIINKQDYISIINIKFPNTCQIRLFHN
jgi:hypothetical protein